MKKYIRTKDGILDTKLLVKCNDERIENGWFTKSGVPIIAIKQADNIEELCDEFITVYLDGFHQLNSFPSKVNVILGHSVYGAIWTNQGLIYVAKMDDKGELELL